MVTPRNSSSAKLSTSQKRYKVFVSSTFLDNEERRRTVADVISTAGMVWHGMELFTASTRPTVEECIRHSREADLLVGIIAWRYGWEPDGKKSITEMEYDAAKQRLMFLIDPSLPINPEKDFDQGPDRWEKQKKLEAFKKRFATDQMPAYFNETTLGSKVLHALNEWQARQEKQPEEKATPEAPPKEPTPGGTPLAQTEIDTYRRKAEALHASLPVAGFAKPIRVPIDIEDIYVPLHAMLDLSGSCEAVYGDADEAEKCLRGQSLEIALPEAFRQAEQRRIRGITILGDPGSGKTTHLKRLLLGCLRKKPEDYGLPADMLPVFLPLRELTDLDRGLAGFIEAQLASPHLKTQPGFGARLLEWGNLLLLFDGLDEVADTSRREQVARWIMAALKDYDDCCSVVTCRFAGYSPKVRLSAEFLEMHIRPMNRDQMKRFIQNWYRAVEKRLSKDPELADGVADEKAADLIKRLSSDDFRARRVFELTRNPLLLTNICLVHRHRGRLPQQRAQLYEECIDVLLEHWRGAKGLDIGLTAKAGRRVLQPAAYWMHSEESRTRATAVQLAPHIEPALKEVKWSGGSADAFLRTIRDQSGLLTGWDQENYGFMHLGFQEYLAAREIRGRAFKDPQILKELACHFGESWWQEVGLVLLALEDPSLFEPYMREVVKQPAFAEHPQLVEACLDDAAEVSVEPFVELLKVKPGKKPELWHRQLLALQLVARIDAGVLDELRPRLIKHPFRDIRHWFKALTEQVELKVDTVAEKSGHDLVLVPAGAYMMGSPENRGGRYQRESPQHQVNIPAFYIGRCPVTNDQYNVFLKKNPDAPEPKYWADRKYNQPNQPVVGVSWNEAKQYAQWAGLRLPTEAEWEYACRAGTQTHYCSGDKESDLERVGWYEKNSGDELHPIGAKEPNIFGLYDMHGNVWEWVEDAWHSSYEKAPINGSAWVDDPRGGYRVLRGGGWFTPAHFCQSAFRYYLEPGSRNRVGFRLSRSVDANDE